LNSDWTTGDRSINFHIGWILMDHFPSVGLRQLSIKGFDLRRLGMPDIIKHREYDIVILLIPQASAETDRCMCL
jgi:hypothetical protein